MNEYDKILQEESFPVDQLPKPNPGPSFVSTSVLVASALGVVLLIYFASKALRRYASSRRFRVVCSAIACWFFLVEGWGYVFSWNDYFDPAQYAAIHILPVFGGLSALFLLTWIKQAPSA